MSTLKREYQRHLSEQTRALEDATGQRDQTQEQMDKIVRDKAAVDIELKAWKERATILMEDAERMRRQNHSLLQESADKEMKITQANKQHAQDKEDIYGLNVALDSKQQELELVSHAFLSSRFHPFDTFLSDQEEDGCQRHCGQYACSSIQSRTTPS